MCRGKGVCSEKAPCALLRINSVVFILDFFVRFKYSYFGERFLQGVLMIMKKLFLLLILLLLGISTLAVSADFEDNFSNSNHFENGWHQSILLGLPQMNYIYPARNRLSVHMPDYDTALYLMNSNTFADDSSVEATFENVYSSNSQYGIICRYHDYGWYEFRIIVSGENAGSYTIYKYDQYLKSQGKVPYVKLHPGMDRYFSNDIKLGINVKNTLKMICRDDEIRIFINGNEQFPIQNGKLTDPDFTDGENGFVVWTQTPGGYAQIDLTGFRSLSEN